MIEQLTIRNFQAHGIQEIELDPRITCIVGKSDVGKSAIVRALWWVCSNRPTGNAFLKDGEEEVSVELQLDGGHTIIRKRGARNLYIVDGQELEAFGNDVPAEVSKLLNLGRSNFQLQLDAPFWFSLTPGQVSKELNAIVNLGAIDESLAYLGKELRTAKAEVSVLRGQLKEAKARREELDWVPEMSRDLEVLTTLQRERESRASRLASLERLVEEVSSYQERIDRASGAHREAQQVLAQGEKSLQSLERSQGLADLLKKITQERERICHLRNEVKTKEKELKRRTKGRCPLCGNQFRSPSLPPIGT